MIRFLIFLLTLLIGSNVYAQSVDVKNWTQDIDAYKTNLEKYHIDLYHKINKSDFEQEVQQIKSILNEKTELETITALMRLTRKVGDGHTAVSLRNMEIHLFPIEIYQVNGQWRVIKTTSNHKELLGKILTKIDGKSIENITKEVSQVAQYVENDQSKIFRTGQYLVIAELLHGLRLTKHKLEAEFSFLDDNNKESTVLLNGIKRDIFYEKTEFETFDIVTPEIEKPADAKHDFLWFSPIKNTDGIYIKFESYPSFQEMEQFGKSVLNYINENQTKQVIIDLRNNGGGDFFVGTFLAYYLNLANSVDWKSGVYVLTDRVTFSAGTNNASQFRQMLNAKIIGEPTGSNPTGYQDMGQFTLPHSKLVVTYSKRLFRFQESVTQGIQPNVRLEYDWESHAKGTDNMLEWVINEIQK